MNKVNNIENYNEEGLDISRYDFSSFRMERSIRDIMSWEERHIIIVPNFQRDFVWDYYQSCRFIESILLNLPVPNFFVYRDKKENSETYLLIDGLQRYTCIKQFISGIYKNNKEKREFRIKIKNSKWDGLTFNDLSPQDKASFNDYSLTLNVLEPLSNSESEKKKYMIDLFERINSGSEKLTSQEIRNAVYSGDPIEKLHVFARKTPFKTILPKKYKERFRDEEFYLRLLTYYHIYLRLTKYNSSYFVSSENKEEGLIKNSIKESLSQYLTFSNKGMIDYNSHFDVLDKAANVLSLHQASIFNGASLDTNKLTNKFHDVFSEALFINVMIGNKIEIPDELLNKRKEEYWVSTPKDNNPFYSNTSSKENILERVYIVNKMIKK